MVGMQKVCEKDGRDIYTYQLENAQGALLTATNYGATIMALKIPDGQGKLTDVVLGFSTPQEYFGEHPYFGATIGRCTNRIAGGKFMLDGELVSIPCNENGVNLLHGGDNSFNRGIWSGEIDKNTLTLCYDSPDGEDGFPGKVDVRLEMTLTDENALRLVYTAHTDRTTLVNLTNHAYFNMQPYEGIEDHILCIDADYYTPVDKNLIPTGEIAPVASTPFDFTVPRALGQRIDEDNIQLKRGGGYDHNYVLRGSGFRRAARVQAPQSGLAMEVYTDKPGMQFYTAQNMPTMRGKNGALYKTRAAYCFEPQFYPDSVNHPDFPSCVLRPGEEYHYTTEYRFL